MGGVPPPSFGPQFGSTKLNKLVWDRKKNMTARDVTGFYAIFSAQKSGNFPHLLGRLPYQATQKACRERKNNTGEN